MKKQLSILLALLLVFPVVLSACGNQQEDARDQLGTRPMETIAPVKKETTAPTEEETVPLTEEETEPPTDEETLAPTDVTEAPTGAEASNPVPLGQIHENTYTNEYLGFGMDLNDDWTLYGAEDLLDIPANIKEQTTDTEFGDAIAQAEQIADMMAESSTGLYTINILYMKQSPQELAAHQAMSQEENIDFILLQRDTMIRNYEQMGMKVESMEKASVSFLEESVYGVKTIYDIQGIPCYMLHLFFLDKGEYMATMTFTSYLTDETETMADLCYLLD